MQIFREMFPEKSILLFDNDLTSELGHSFGFRYQKYNLWYQKR